MSFLPSVGKKSSQNRSRTGKRTHRSCVSRTHATSLAIAGIGEEEKPHIPPTLTRFCFTGPIGEHVSYSPIGEQLLFNDTSTSLPRPDDVRPRAPCCFRMRLQQILLVVATLHAFVNATHAAFTCSIESLRSCLRLAFRHRHGAGTCVATRRQTRLSGFD